MIDYNDYFEYMSKKKKRKVKKWRKDRTLNTYINNTKTFINFYKGSLREINNDTIKEYKKHLFDKGYSAATINLKLTSVAQLIKYLNNSKGYKIYNTRIEKIEIPKKESLEKVITREEFKLIQEKCRRKKDIRSLAIFNFLYYTGARIDELQQVRYKDLNKDKVLVLGKNDVHRHLYIDNPLLRRTLNAYLKIRINNSNLLFTGERGSLSKRRMQQLWELYRKECEIDNNIGIHSLRHLYALEFMKENNDIFELKKRLGHKHIETTEIYLLKKDELIKSQTNKIK